MVSLTNPTGFFRPHMQPLQDSLSLGHVGLLVGRGRGGSVALEAGGRGA